MDLFAGIHSKQSLAVDSISYRIAGLLTDSYTNLKLIDL